MNNKQKIQELIKKLRATDDIEEQDNIKQEIDFLEEDINQIKYQKNITKNKLSIMEQLKKDYDKTRKSI